MTIRYAFYHNLLFLAKISEILHSHFSIAYSYFVEKLGMFQRL